MTAVEWGHMCACDSVCLRSLRVGASDKVQVQAKTMCIDTIVQVSAFRGKVSVVR